MKKILLVAALLLPSLITIAQEMNNALTPRRQGLAVIAALEAKGDQAGLETALAKTGLQPFYTRSGYGCRALSVPLDKGQIFFLTEYRDNAGLLQYSLDFEMACDTHIVISADEVYRLTARLQKLLNSQETSFAALLTGFFGESLQTGGAMLDSASDLVLDTYHMLDKLDVIYNTFHYD